MTQVLVVAAHPDDEVLGCGGAIARHANAGAHVRVLFLADGVSSRGDGRVDPEELALREACALSAAKELGCSVAGFGRFPDNRLDTVALLTLVQWVESSVREFSPDVIYTHHPSDLNIDHRLTAQAVLTAFRPTPSSTWQRIVAFEVPSSSDWAVRSGRAVFEPDTFVDISATLETKLRAYGRYETEVPRAPHTRSLEGVEALARLRGVQSGLAAAECFCTLRHVVRSTVSF